MRSRTKIGVMLASVISASMLAACTDQSGEQSSADSAYPEHSVAIAKNAKWPDVEVVDTDLMDSNPNRENIMVVLDMSGSMGETSCSGGYPTKSVAAKSVLREWVQSVDSEANLGLIIFDTTGTSVRLPLGRDNRQEFVAMADSASPDGGTPLKDAVGLAGMELERQAALQQGYGRYSMMVITDGVHSIGQDPSEPIYSVVGNPANPIEINTVGFCITDSALNQPGLTTYRSAKNPEELRKGLDSVLAESMDFAPIEEFNDDA